MFPAKTTRKEEEQHSNNLLTPPIFSCLPGKATYFFSPQRKFQCANMTSWPPWVYALYDSVSTAGYQGFSQWHTETLRNIVTHFYCTLLMGSNVLRQASHSLIKLVSWGCVSPGDSDEQSKETASRVGWELEGWFPPYKCHWSVIWGFEFYIPPYIWKMCVPASFSFVLFL